MDVATNPRPTSRSVLWRVKLAHTLIWALVAGAIVAVPILTSLGKLNWALGASLLVWAEVAVLVLNGMRCPLTAIAARHTPDRQDNFDIFLPVWLARNNKGIFGSLFAAGELFLLLRWITH